MENTESRFEQLRGDLTKAARGSFTAYREQHPDEDLYAFALYTDQDAGGPSPAVCSEQSLARAVKSYSDEGREPPEMAFLRYNPDETAFYLGAEGNLDDWCKIWETVDELSEDDSMPFPTFRRRVWKTLILALADLDAEGFFGADAERERIILLIWPSETNESEQWWIRSVRELNPKTVYERFVSELPPSCEEALAADARFVQEVIRRILERLRQDMAKAARNTFASYREQHPDEDFRAFGVVTDANVRTWLPVANTEQSIEEAIQEYIKDGEEVPELSQMRYCPMKWGISGDEGEGKQAWRGIRAMQDVLREYPAPSPGAYREKMLETMILALKDLDAEGFFGTGAERERVILVIWVAESDDTAKWWIRSAKELNPQAVYERFMSELPSWCQYEGETLEPSQARSDDAEARQEAADALEEMESLDIPALVELLEDAAPAVRARAASSLGCIGAEAKAALPAMVPLLADPDLKVCWDTRQALLDLCWGASDAGCDLSSEAEAVVPVLTEFLAHERADTRRTAAHVLGELGPHAAAAVPALLRLLEDENENVCDAGAGALARIGSETPGAVPLGKLTDLLRNEDEVIREAAGQTLIRLKSHAAPATPALLALLDDPDPEVRASAAGVLGCIGADAETAVPALTALLEEEDFGVLYQAAYALGAFGAAAGPAVPALARLTGHEQAGVISARTLGEIGPAAKAAVPALMERLQDERSTIRSSAAYGLGGIGPEAADALPALEKLAQDDHDEVVRQAAAEAIEVIQGKRPRPVRETPTYDID